MKRAQDRLENSKVYPYKFGWWEVKMGVLLLFILGMLIAGTGIQRRSRLGDTSDERIMQRPRVWEWNKPLEQRLGVTFKQPWEMTEADLTRGRVVYNLITKPGFRWLAGQLLLGMIGVGLATNGLLWMAGWQWRQLKRLSAVATSVAQTTVRIEIAGTVQIASQRGLIYAAVTDDSQTGEDSYGFYIANVKVSIHRQ